MRERLSGLLLVIMFPFLIVVGLFLNAGWGGDDD